MRFVLYWVVNGVETDKTIYTDNFDLLREDIGALLALDGIEQISCYGFRTSESRFDPAAFCSGQTTRYFHYKSNNIAA